MSTRTKVAAVVGGVAVAGTMFVGAGDASAWKDNKANMFSGTVADKVPSVTVVNYLDKKVHCLVSLYDIDKLSAAKNVRAAAEAYDRAIGTAGEADAKAKAEAASAALGNHVMIGGAKPAPHGGSANAYFLEVPDASKADSYTVFARCLIDELGPDGELPADRHYEVFGIGAGQTGKDEHETVADGGNGSSDTFGSLEGILPDLGSLVG